MNLAKATMLEKLQEILLAAFGPLEKISCTQVADKLNQHPRLLIS
jgi:hypothetical protein